MTPRMVPLTVCARREYIAASTRLVHITTRNMFLPTDVFSILFCRCAGSLCDVDIRSTPLEMTSAAEAATKREGFRCRALSAVSFQRTAFRCYFCKESIRCQSAAQADNRSRSFRLVYTSTETFENGHSEGDGYGQQNPVERGCRSCSRLCSLGGEPQCRPRDR